MLSTFLTTLLIIDALVIIVLVIALQQGNEGGIGSAFGSDNSAGFFGASGGVTYIVRATWIAGTLFFILTTSLAWLKTREHFGVGRELEGLLENTEGAVPVGTATPDALGTAAAGAGTAAPAEAATPAAAATVEAAPAQTPAVPGAPTIVPTPVQ